MRFFRRHKREVDNESHAGDQSVATMPASLPSSRRHKPPLKRYADRNDGILWYKKSGRTGGNNINSTSTSDANRNESHPYDLDHGRFLETQGTVVNPQHSILQQQQHEHQTFAPQTGRNQAHFPKGEQQQQQQQQQQPQQQRRQQQELVLPQDKVRKAILAADEGYEPSDYALNSQDPQTLIQEVEGPSLQSYQGREPFATEKTVNVNGESSLSVPIQVDVPGSIVSYVVEKRSADFSDFMFGIASRNVINEVEVVKDLEPFDMSVKNSGGSAGGRKTAKRMTDSLLVSAGSAPCTLQFQFENKNPFNVELSYSIRVLPPPDKETVVLGRKLRAQACVSLLEEELRELVPKQSAAESDVRRLEQEVESLESSVEEMSKTLRAVKEQEWRSKLEMEQQMEQQQQQS